MSPLKNVDVDQYDHVDLLDAIRDGYADTVHGMGAQGPTKWNCNESARRNRNLVAAEAATDLEVNIANRYQVTLIWQQDVSAEITATTPPTMKVFTDGGNDTLTADLYVAACASGDPADAACVSSFTADGTTNTWNDGTTDWWTFTIFPTTLDGAWGEDDTYCWYVRTSPSPGDGTAGDFNTDPICHTFSYGESDFDTVILGADFWLPEDYDFDTSNIDHNGAHGSLEYLNQEHRIEEALLADPTNPWDVVDFTDYYDGFSAINFPGDRKAKRMDWHKLVYYNYETTGEMNRVFNGMTAAEWKVKHFEHDHEQFDDMNDTWTSARRNLHEDSEGLGHDHHEPWVDCIEDTPECAAWKMPSVTESIDGGICGMVVWRAYPRMVDSNGDITNRAYEWLEGGFADNEDSYKLWKGRRCGWIKNGKRGLKKADDPHESGNGEKIGHRNKDFKGSCFFNEKAGKFDLAARVSREEPPCGEGVDITLGSYQPCATTMDAAAAAGGARRLQDTEWGGVTVTPTWEGDAVIAQIEECDNTTGECTQTDVVNGDSYTFNFDADVAYNFIGKNEYGETVEITMDYAWFAASGASTLAASLLAGAAIINTLF